MSKDWRKDPVILRIMKLRKRHVRLALARLEKEREVADADRPCYACNKTASAIYEDGKYKGHECPDGHMQYLSKRVRDPLAKIVPTEKADPRATPSQGREPPPLTAQEVKSSMERQRAIQKQFESETGDTSWKTATQ
jgi:hypothetical protein